MHKTPYRTDRTITAWNLDQREIIRQPMSRGVGHWVGAPSIFVDGEIIYLTYRYRRPRGEGRGFEARVARSVDGRQFEDVWAIRQEQLNTSSMERFAMTRAGDTYLLYVSYVDPEDNRWRIDVLEAPSPEAFDPACRRPALTASQVGLEAAKDPVVFPAFGHLFMYVSVAERQDEAEGVQHHYLHVSKDVYTTGLIYSGTGLAVSTDGREWSWLGMALDPVPKAWDAYATRITSVLPMDTGYLLFYDGSAAVSQNYEERTGIALTADLRHVTRLTPSGPRLTSPYEPGTLRYVDYAKRGDDIYFYYEMVEADGSHSLGLNVVPLA